MPLEPVTEQDLEEHNVIWLVLGKIMHDFGVWIGREVGPPICSLRVMALEVHDPRMIGIDKLAPRK